MITIEDHNGIIKVMKRDSNELDQEEFDPDNIVAYINIPACGGHL